MNEIFFIILGLLGLWWGSDFAVEAARRIAVKLRVSDLIIGLTITSIGTSLPEIATNVMAGFAEEDASGLAVGNIIGSDLCQITLLLGIVGFMATLTIPKRALKRDGFMLFIALILMYITASDGHVTRGEGILLVFTYIIYLIYLLNQERVLRNNKTKKESGKGSHTLGIDLIKTFVGLTFVVAGAYLIVENGVSIASRMGITESLIGIFVGLGTSIPELTVSLRAIKQKAGELSLGNLIGSNITDPLLSFGLGASVAGVSVTSSVIHFDFVYWMVATAIALLLLYNHMNLNRKESTVLIILYLLFIYLKVMFFLTG
ncbi:MAG: calcium/sodium antiporter [Candidatus Altiarchaeota archaeon]|nr:calcium/sodium antiporter [Candidatus Altiarchaeota archaeon]